MQRMAWFVVFRGRIGRRSGVVCGARGGCGEGGLGRWVVLERWTCGMR